jgi:hypothetical protein
MSQVVQPSWYCDQVESKLSDVLCACDWLMCCGRAQQCGLHQAQDAHWLQHEEACVVASEKMHTGPSIRGFEAFESAFTGMRSNLFRRHHPSNADQ